MIVSWYERENRFASSRCLKTASDGADAMWRGRSFQAVAPETVNARLPTVERNGQSFQTNERWKTAAVVWMSCLQNGWNTTVSKTQHSSKIWCYDYYIACCVIARRPIWRRRSLCVNKHLQVTCRAISASCLRYRSQSALKNTSMMKHTNSWTHRYACARQTNYERSVCVLQWSFRKTGTMGTMASQAEIGVWVQVPGALLRESGGSTAEKFSRLYMQNFAI